MPYKLFLLIVNGAGSLLMGKPGAPVEIVGSMGASSGSVKITFKKAAQLVEVQVWGTDGLAVSGNKIRVTNGTYAAGQTLELKVDYSDHRNVVVAVNGKFGASKGSRVASFTVGSKTLPSRYPITTDENGRRIIEMRGKGKK